MNQSEIRAMRQRLESRQAASFEADPEMIPSAIVLILFLAVLLFA